MTGPEPLPVEQVLRAELDRGDVALATAQPILRHLIANDEHALFSDEVIARIRGMLLDVARQLLEIQANAAGVPDRQAFVAAHQDALAQPLFGDAAFLAHAHAAAVEAQLLDKLLARTGIDPVLTPLVQDVAASGEPTAGGLAIGVLASQARFVQHQRRMELPLRDLPGDLFHAALMALQAYPHHEQPSHAAEQRLRADYTEGAGRAALLARLVTSLEGRAAKALAIDHAGLSIFITALAMASGQARDLAVLSLAGQQYARLALSLRAAGLSQDAIEAQFLCLHPDIALPDGFDQVRPDVAAALLAGSLATVG